MNPEHQTKVIEFPKTPAWRLAVAELCQRGHQALQMGDTTTAARQYRTAARAGSADGQYHLAAVLLSGGGSPKAIGEVIDWLNLAAEQGHAPAQAALGFLLAADTRGPPNYAAARHWFSLAADQGHAPGCLGLAEMYATGRGVPKKRSVAAKLYRQAAYNGYGPAQRRLADLYFFTKRDANLVEAVKWYRVVAERGDLEARQILQIIAERVEVPDGDEPRLPSRGALAAHDATIAPFLALFHAPRKIQAAAVVERLREYQRRLGSATPPALEERSVPGLKVELLRSCAAAF